MHSATIKYFKTLELIHFQIKIPKGGQAKAKEGRMLPPPPLKEILEDMAYAQLNHIGNYNVLYIKCLNSTIYYSMSSRVLSQLASNSQIVANLYFIGGPKLAKGDQFWLPKLVRTDRFWQQKLLGGTNFGKSLCLNQCSQTNFRG